MLASSSFPTSHFILCYLLTLKKKRHYYFIICEENELMSKTYFFSLVKYTAPRTSKKCPCSLLLLTFSSFSHTTVCKAEIVACSLEASLSSRHHLHWPHQIRRDLQIYSSTTCDHLKTLICIREEMYSNLLVFYRRHDLLC